MSWYFSRNERIRSVSDQRRRDEIDGINRLWEKDDDISDLLV